MSHTVIRTHRWRAYQGRRWNRLVVVCEECGDRRTAVNEHRGCLGIVGVLLRDGEVVPARWAEGFVDRFFIATGQQFRGVLRLCQGPGHYTHDEYV